ncbi:MAG: T9SS type A sorting domain-containing protein, partial [Bacteroidota bacterium]|nr:T9SS type A sorting domain-containing protein [Bacteroidota bacterium]
SNSEINDVNITIFPNPATNEIVVIGNLVNSSKLILTDNIGRIVSVTNIDKNNNTHKINVKNLSQGIYFISIDNNTIKKVVKQ